MENEKYATRVTVARALKEKNRIANKLNIVRTRIRNENSVESNIKRTFDIKALVAEEAALYNRLVAVKTAIAVANAEIAEKLIRMSELKAAIEWYRGIPTKEGTFQETNYRDTTITRTFTTVLSGQEVIQLVEETQAQIENLQDEIDEFNATKYIEIPA